MEKQKVLIVHNHYQFPGGEDTVVDNEKKMLEKYGHEVILYTRDNAELECFSVFQKIKLPLTAMFSKKSYSEVKKIIQKQHIDLVHVHNTLHLISPSIYYAAINCKVPVVQTLHNFRVLCPGAAFYRDGHICEDCITKGLRCAIMHKCYRQSRIQTLFSVMNTKIHSKKGIYKKLNYICLTKFNKEKLLSSKQFQLDNIFIKPNFTKSIGKVVSVEERIDRFVFAGRLEKLKGIDILLNAWKSIGNPAPKLLICGTGEMEKWCNDYIKKNNLTSVEMKGYISNMETRKLIGSSKALIFPSQWYEGFGMSIIEAFSVGTPVIVSDLGNAGGLVTEGITGCKFKSDSPKELARAVFRIEEYKDIYTSTVAEYKKKYTEEINYTILKEIYNTVMKKQGLNRYKGK